MSRIRHIGGAVTAVRVLDVFSELSRLESRVRNSISRPRLPKPDEEDYYPRGTFLD